MVVPFGSARERRSRTTYRPTVTPEGSTHVDTAFTGTTSSFSRTASGKLAVVAVVRQPVLRRLPLQPAQQDGEALPELLFRWDGAGVAGGGGQVRVVRRRQLGDGDGARPRQRSEVLDLDRADQVAEHA